MSLSGVAAILKPLGARGLSAAVDLADDSYPIPYPRADFPDRPLATGRNYLQPQQIISSQSRKLPADITELPQPLEVPPAPSHGFAISCFRAPPSL